VISIEFDLGKHRIADERFRWTKLRDRLNLRPGAATDVVEDLERSFDLAFFDADSTSAPVQPEKLLPQFSPDAILLADNVISHLGEIAGYLDKPSDGRYYTYPSPRWQDALVCSTAVAGDGRTDPVPRSYPAGQKVRSSLISRLVLRTHARCSPEQIARLSLRSKVLVTMIRLSDWKGAAWLTGSA